MLLRESVELPNPIIEQDQEEEQETSQDKSSAESEKEVTNSSVVSLFTVCLTLVILISIIAIVLATGLGLGLNGYYWPKKECTNHEVYRSPHGSYQYAGVTTDNKICSKISTDVLARHRGNAIDAAVAALLCIGVLSSQDSGIGGGSFAMVYDNKKNGWHAVDFRESAPSAATEQMYSVQGAEKNSRVGGLAIAVPGTLRGALKIHQMFGIVPWRTLVMPSVKLLEDGFPLSKPTRRAISKLEKSDIDKGFGMFMDDNGKPLPLDSLIKMPKLAKTYQHIADNPNSFYNGILAADVAHDIKESGGIITVQDLKEYTVKIKVPLKLDLPDNMTLYSLPPPSSGSVLAFILSVLSGYNMTADSISSNKKQVLTYHRIVEAMKFAFAKGPALGDEDFVDMKTLVRNLTSKSYGEETRLLINDTHTQEVLSYKPPYSNLGDQGTGQINVLDGEGNAVSIASTINYDFGSKVVGSRTGIIFNNEMANFALPGASNSYGLLPSPYNFIKPNKRPMSSLCPALVWDKTKKRVCLVMGSSGGSKTITSTALTIIDTLWLNKSIVEAVEHPRLHHQLIPESIQVQNTYPKKLRKGLEAKGHRFVKGDDSSVQVVGLLRNEIEAVADYRKDGAVGGL